ncbi:hypothetical protein N7470_005167 [Penicillium chermesinum]|nr:hypothetical protein N7470_005167 [Penicillium chermesinum]
MAYGMLVAGLLSLAVAASSQNVAQRVSSNSVSGMPLFPSETLQLTDEALSRLAKDQRAWFEFGSNGSVSAARSLWPSENIWELFDWVLGTGSLIKTVPLATVCYPSEPDYDSAKCEEITDNWTNSYLHAADPASIMWPLFEGRTCLPTNQNVTADCTLGGYSSYAVNVSHVAQIQLAVNFARLANLRLVVKNTGHDFSGKSTGAGALGIWTHNLKEMEYYENYRGSGYQGPALKMGAGVQAFDTVGVAGGYVLGGGHSPMSSIYGLAADQVLALEVVLANGRFVTVTEETDPDLFWALCGGGGGTYGVVTSVISRLRPKVDTFWAGIRSYMQRFPTYADAGTYAYFWVLPTGPGAFEFLMNPFFGVNHTLDEFNALVKPWFDDLKALGIPFTPNSTYFPDFYDAWAAGFPLETVASSTMLTGSRLFPRANWEDESKFNATFAALRSTITAGHPLLAFNMKVDLPEGSPENSANPAWRKTLMHAITSTTWNTTTPNAEIKQIMDTFTYDTLGQWRATCPDAGAYMSESDVLEPNFEQAFYGSNYDRLYKLKQRYDPTGLFYAVTAVGSENWQVKSLDGLPDQNGRLCRI